MKRKNRYKVERRARIDQRLMVAKKAIVPPNKKESTKIVPATPKKYKEDQKTDEEQKVDAEIRTRSY